ncbi:prolipoprotein diacylglyceryl transferase [Salana multivorans]
MNLADGAVLLAEGIPSPSQGVWYLGPLPIRAYALCILLGGVIAYKILQRRYVARGGPAAVIPDIVIWAVAFGIIGARIYHVVSSPDAYFGPDGVWWKAFYIWEGGLGIWGAIGFGALGAWIGVHRVGLRMAPFADALAPGLLVAQAIGRLGNYFNQELFGGPTTLPWGLRVDDSHLVAAGFEPGTLVHPTFLYELIWNLAMAGVLVWADRRFRLGHGRVFWLYVMLYTAGRGWIEAMRVDEAQLIAGLRLNVWTSIIVFLVALACFVVIGRRHPGRDDDVWLPGRRPEVEAETGAETGSDEGAETGSETGSETPSATSTEADSTGPDDVADPADVVDDVENGTRS